MRIFKLLNILLVSLALNLSWSAAHAVDQDIEVFTNTIRKLYPSTKFENIGQTSVPGIYEVQMGKNLAYVDRSGRYFVFGHLYDMSTQKDLTAAKLDDLNRIEFAALPFGDAIKIVRGNGNRKLAIFSDPDCPYCRKLEGDLIKLDNVTIYTFPFPLDGLHPDAKRKAVAIWCAKDRASTWESVLLRNANPPTVECDNPIERNIALGQKLNINGTPMIISADGRSLPGAVAAEQLDTWLDQSKLAQAKPGAASAAGAVPGTRQ